MHVIQPKIKVPLVAGEQMIRRSWGVGALDQLAEGRELGLRYGHRIAGRIQHHPGAAQVIGSEIVHRRHSAIQLTMTQECGPA
jgi:hypothetical protein